MAENEPNAGDQNQNAGDQNQNQNQNAGGDTLLGDQNAGDQNQNTGGQNAGGDNTLLGGDDTPGADTLGAPEGDYEMPELPEGVTIVDDAFAAFSGKAKELNLSQKAFNELVSWQTDMVKSQVAAAEAQRAENRKAILDDPNKDEILANAKLALRKHGNPEIQQLLSDPTLGLGDNPTIVRFLSAIGASLNEDGMDGGTGGSGGDVEKTVGEILYSNM